MNFDRNISTTQLTGAVGLLLGLGVAFVLGSAVGNNDFQKVALVLGAGIGIGVFLALGKNYWLLIPLSLGAKFPALPLGGRAVEFPELCIAGCAVFFALRVATRRERLRLLRPMNVPFVLFMIWVAMVFLVHPIGLSMLGANVAGGRFYIKMALAFASFVILCNRTYTEQDISRVLALLVFGAFFGMVYGIYEYTSLGPTVDAATGIATDEFYSWHQVLSLPAITIAFLIFSRWSPQQVLGLQRPGILFLFVACFALALLSGKRMGLTAVLLAPIVSSVMFRQYRYITVALIGLAIMMATLVSGQGQWFNLPLVAQRTLSWLPGDWDPELENIRGGADDFRKELRRLAMDNIKADPIVGQGYAMNIGDILTTMTLQKQVGGIEVVTAGHAISRNWHNIWLGYAADFGIPLSLFQAAIFLVVLFVSNRNFKTFSNRCLMGVFSLYVFMFTVRDLVASHTSGHTALDAFERWWMYGIVVAIYYGAAAGMASAKSSPDIDSGNEPKGPIA